MKRILEKKNTLKYDQKVLSVDFGLVLLAEGKLLSICGEINIKKKNRSLWIARI